jgi:hypothetical protein
MMEVEKLCERLLAKMEAMKADRKTDKEDFMGRMDANRKAWREKADANMKAWGKKSSGCGLRQRIPERRRWPAKRWRHVKKRKSHPQWTGNLRLQKNDTSPRRTPK